MRTVTLRRLLARPGGQTRAVLAAVVLVASLLASAGLAGAEVGLAWGATGGGGVTTSSDGEHLLVASVGQAVAGYTVSDEGQVLASGFLPLARGAAPAEGAVTCTILPEAVRGLGAQWRLTSGPDVDWKGSGATVTGVPVAGNPYTITFSAVTGWVSPVDQTLDVIADEVVAKQGLYVLRHYSLTFLAGPHGALAGSMVQDVAHGSDSTPVTALPAYEFVFQQWSNGFTANPLRLTDVTASQTLTASFRAANPVAPAGQFLGLIGGAAASGGRGLWDLTGPYAISVGGDSLHLGLVHDTRGRLMGTATYTAAKATVVTMPIRGSTLGTGEALPVKLILRGADVAGSVAVDLTLALTIEVNTRQLTGSLVGSVTKGGTATPVSMPVELPIPAPMDGSWSLQLEIAPTGRIVEGTARLLLSNGVGYDYTVNGRVAGQTAVLKLAGVPGDPAARGITARVTVVPLEGGWATLQAFSAQGYGQVVSW